MNNTLIKDKISVVVPGTPSTPSTPATPGYAGQAASTQIVGLHSQQAIDFFNTYYTAAGNSGYSPFLEYQGFYIANGQPAPVYVLGVPNGGSWALRIRYTYVPAVPPTIAIPGSPAVPDMVVFDSNVGWNSSADSIASLPTTYSPNTGTILPASYMQFQIDDSVVGVACGTDYGFIPPPVSYVGNVLGVTHGFLMQSGTLTIVDPFLTPVPIPHANRDVLKMLFIGQLVIYQVNNVEVGRAPLPVVGPIYMAAQLYSAGDYVFNPALAPITALNAPSLSFQPLSGFASEQVLTVVNASFKPLKMIPPAGDVRVLGYLGHLWTFGGEGTLPHGVGLTNFQPLRAQAHITDLPRPAVTQVYTGFQPLRTAATLVTYVPGSASTKFRAIDSKSSLDGVGYFQVIASFQPMSADAFMYEDSKTEAWAYSATTEASSALAQLVSSVVVSSSMQFASLGVTDSFFDVSGISALGVGSTALTQTLLNAIATSIMNFGSFLPIYDELGTTYVLNKNTDATSTYTGQPFTNYTKIGQRYYGVSSDGLYLLEGDDDNGVPIIASMAFGKIDFGTTAKKRVTDVYLGVASTGQLVLNVTVEGREFHYVQQRYSPEQQVQRFVPGKGLSGTFLSFELVNPAAMDFNISSIEFQALPLTRRI